MLEELVAQPHCIYVYGCNKICLNYSLQGHNAEKLRVITVDGSMGSFKSSLNCLGQFVLFTAGDRVGQLKFQLKFQLKRVT